MPWRHHVRLDILKSLNPARLRSRISSSSGATGAAAGEAINQAKKGREDDRGAASIASGIM